MKRLIIGIVIIVCIIALGIFAIAYISEQNTRLYGKIEEVLIAYDSGEEVAPLLDELEDIAYNYSRKLTLFVNDEELSEMLETVAMMRAFYSSDPPEFKAQAARLRYLAERIYSDEVCHMGRIF